ncbi:MULTISPECIES: putative sulfate/molybdate transporter [Halomonas]|uniref:MFS superfamily molybdate transporter n=1 Tax=Halomonas ventosae TaxID=229007 RepID=A0A4V3C1R8_9GAMM|nr:putative sulfate/molybdate transporter [Halomonas ventosae]TDO15349.1 MFS superfamily molybdate transporter [Halomonas ventosae]
MNISPAWRPLRRTLLALSGDISGAFGDLGTLLPYVIAAIGLGGLAPGPLFLGFAAGYLLVALLYRVPIAVQPMKALGAVVITGGLTASETALAGATIGLVLLALAATPLLGRAARALPQSVVTGLQAGLGLMLASLALEMMASNWWLAMPAMALLSLSWVWPRGPWALMLILAAVWLAPGDAQPLAASASTLDEGVSLSAVASGVLAQLPLTLVNAVVVAAAVAHSLFPASTSRVSERRLAASSGLLNLLLAPLGAMPMCHGAGGMAAHYRFGARSWIAPVTIAVACALAALQGEAVIAWLAAIPVPLVGALLAFAGLELIMGKRLFDARPDCRPVIAVTAVATFFGSALIGLATGLASEQLRRHLVRRRARGVPHDRG